MNNISVCPVSCRWQRSPYEKETEFSEWAMGAQAEALVPSTMCGRLFSRILHVLVILGPYGIQMAVFCSQLLGSVRGVGQKHFLRQLREGSLVYKTWGVSHNSVVWGPPVLYCDD